MIDETIKKLNEAGIKDIRVSLEIPLLDGESGEETWKILHEEKWNVIKTERDFVTGFGKITAYKDTYPDKID
jgi:hypothetical protein